MLQPLLASNKSILNYYYNNAKQSNLQTQNHLVCSLNFALIVSSCLESFISGTLKRTSAVKIIKHIKI